MKKLNSNYQKILLNITNQSKKFSEKNKKINKLPILEKIDKLLDQGSPFLELSQLAGYELYENEEVPRGGLVTGIGLIENQLCMIIANDPQVKAGAYYPITIKKHIRAQQIALENKLTCIYITDSAGVHLEKQADVFPDTVGLGQLFNLQALMQKDKIPQIAMVNGKCAGGGAYVAAMCDQIVMVKQNAAIFLGGPSLVKAATGEIVSEEELGGAETHTSISGVADYFANDELEGLQKIRMIIKESFQNQQTYKYYWQKFDNIEEPIFNPQEINYLLNDDLKNYQIDVRQIIARFVDGSKFLEYKKQYGPTLVTGFAQLYGQNVGIIGNNGILFSESSLKATNFIELCSQRKIPLLFLQNLPGFMVGKYYEHQGIAKHGAKLVNAIASTQVPKITLLFGGSYGAGNFGMCGRGLNPRFFFQLPNSRISVMGGQQAADVLAERKQHSLKKQNKQILSQQDIQNYKKEVIDMYEKQSQIYYSSANLWDDGVILPEQIRQQLGLSLLITLKEKIPEFNGFGTFRM